MKKYYKCAHCGQIIEKVKNTGVPVICCGEAMHELVPNTTDAANEKHVPVISIENNLVTVTVGSVIHPMLPEHFIEWITLETNKGSYTKRLTPNTQPIATFLLTDGEEVVKAYEYCNLHSLWVKEN